MYLFIWPIMNEQDFGMYLVYIPKCGVCCFHMVLQKSTHWKCTLSAVDLQNEGCHLNKFSKAQHQVYKCYEKIDTNSNWNVQCAIPCNELYVETKIP